MVITIEIIWLVVFGVAILAALFDALVIIGTGEKGATIFPIVLGQWVAPGVVGGILSAILASPG